MNEKPNLLSDGDSPRSDPSRVQAERPRSNTLSVTYVDDFFPEPDAVLDADPYYRSVYNALTQALVESYCDALGITDTPVYTVTLPASFWDADHSTDTEPPSEPYSEPGGYPKCSTLAVTDFAAYEQSIARSNWYTIADAFARAEHKSIPKTLCHT